jgi:hypothetical protein
LDGLSRCPAKKLPGPLQREPGKGNKDMENISDVAARRNSETIERKFSLPFGYQATFHWCPSGLETRWSPDVPLIHKAHARRKFFAAYQVARRSFLEEVAAVIGGDVLILDISGLQNAVSAEVVRRPIRH